MDALGWELVRAVLITGVVGYFAHQSQQNLSAKIEAASNRTEAAFRSRHEWKERCLAELLGPLVLRLGQTKRAFDRWKEPNLYLERCVYEGNEASRRLLLEKAHLVPPHLRDDALELIEHFDVWMEEYQRVRGDTRAEESLPYVFVGPKGFGFPRDAERRFQEEFGRLWKEFYDVV